MRNAFLFSRTSSAKKLRARRAEHGFYILLCFTICSYLISRHVSSTSSRRGIFIGVDQWEGTRGDERPHAKKKDPLSSFPPVFSLFFPFFERRYESAAKLLTHTHTHTHTALVIFVITSFPDFAQYANNTCMLLRSTSDYGICDT